MNNVIAFHGANHRCGTTQIVQCCAEYITEHTELRVLLILGATGYGSEYCEVRESMDYIRPYLAEKIVDVEDIIKKALQRGNLFVIGGHENPETADLFSVDMAETLVRALRNQFDLILIDSGSHIEMGCSYGFLFSADQLYMIVNQNESSFRYLEWEQNLYTKLGVQIDAYIVNKYDSHSPYELEYIGNRLFVDKKCIHRVSKHPSGDLAEMNSKSLLQVKGGRRFEKDIKKISEGLIAYVNNEI